MAKVTVSKSVGKMIDVYRASAQGFCAECVTNLKAFEAGILEDEAMNYFDLAFAAYLGETKVAKSKEEENEAYVKRALTEGKKEAAKLTWNMKQETPLYGYFSNTEKLFSLLCSECVGYYVTNKETGKETFVFAKVATVAKNSNNIKQEEKEKLDLLCEEETETGFKCYKYEETDNEGKEYTMYVRASQLDNYETFVAGNVEMRNQRTKVHGNCKEDLKIWRSDKGDILTLAPCNKFSYYAVLPIISKFVSVQADNERKEEKKHERKKQKEAKKLEAVTKKLEDLTKKLEDKTAKFAECKNGLTEAGEKTCIELGKQVEKEIASAKELAGAEEAASKLASALEAFNKAFEASKVEKPEKETPKIPATKGKSKKAKKLA